MKYQRLTEEDEKVFLKTLSSIWDDIGYDCLISIAEGKGLQKKKTDYGTLYPAEQVKLRRSEVIEITTDRFVSIRSDSIPKDQWLRIREWMFKTPNHIVDKVAAKTFKAKYYGA